LHLVLALRGLGLTIRLESPIPSNRRIRFAPINGEVRHLERRTMANKKEFKAIKKTRGMLRKET
jgi:hypothetical protein